MPPQATSMASPPRAADIQSGLAPAAPAASSPAFAGVQTAAVETDTAVPAEPVHDETPLRRDEVREVQERLQAFGFSPGPFDGTTGPMTIGAVMHYQQNRGHLQTGKVDHALLDELRQDPAPKVAPRAPRHHAYYAAARSSAPWRSDPFEPLRTASVRFGQWLQSLTR
jgi:peptidoglycan hydrolase-like protein with peptidoglycan-binding domain